jgi:hypothetical protein
MVVSRRKFLVWSGIAAAAVVSGLLLSDFSALLRTTTNTITTSRTTTTLNTASNSVTYPPENRWVHILPLVDGSTWNFPNYTPQQVLNLIGGLKPNVLYRLMQDDDSPSASLPGGMTIEQFAQQSIDNGSSDSIIIPKISLKTYITDPSTFYDLAQNYYSNFNLNPPMEYLSIDNWNDAFQKSYPNNYPQLAAEISDKLYSQGWKGLEFGACGAPGIENGSESFATFCMDTSSWLPDTSMIQALKSVLPNATSLSCSIDNPTMIASFATLTPDQQADSIAQSAEMQQSNGFFFIYPILYPEYDATKIFTSSTGSYGGQSIYEICLNLMNQYNAVNTESSST